jgi:hypothetical protein
MLLFSKCLLTVYKQTYISKITIQSREKRCVKLPASGINSIFDCRVYDLTATVPYPARHALTHLHPITV